MRFIRAKLTNTPPRAGMAPPDRPVPAPRAVYGTPCALHSLMTADTSWALIGNTTAWARALSIEPSYS